MMENRISILFARRLSGEASDQDLAELNGLLKEYPEASFQLDILLNWWSRRDPLDEIPDLALSSPRPQHPHYLHAISDLNASIQDGKNINDDLDGLADQPRHLHAALD
jgi:hypothetical protein